MDMTVSIPLAQPQYKTTLHVVCAWCHKPMGEVDGKGISGVSHGICPECFDVQMQVAQELIAKLEEDNHA